MALATERKRKSLLRTELEWLGRGARARSTKQKAHIDRIKAMQEIKDIQEEKRVVLDSVASVWEIRRSSWRISANLMVTES